MSASGGALGIPSDVEAGRDDKDPLFVNGDFVWIGARQYRYVKFDNGTDNIAAEAGGSSYWLGYSQVADPTEMNMIATSDYSSGLAITSCVAGVFMNVVTNGYHTFIQTKGYNLAVQVATGAVAGDVLVGDNVDLVFGKITPGSNLTEIPQGYCIGNESYGFATVSLNIPL